MYPITLFRSLSEKQIADIIRTSAKRPDVKKRNIDSAAKKLIDSSYELAKVRTHNQSTFGSIMLIN